MIEIYVFYADVFWFHEWMMNGIILLIASRFRKKCGKRVLFWCAAGAALGALVETALLLTTKSMSLSALGGIGIAIPLMVRIVFGKTPWKRFAENLVLCFGVALLLGGTVTVLENRFIWGRTQILGALLAAVLADLFLFWLYGMYRLQRKLFRVALMHREKIVRCMGLWDSGNLLRNPADGRPVSAVSRDILVQLGVENTEAEGEIMFRALGVREGKVEIYRIDRMVCGEGSRQKREVSPVLLADAGRSLEGQPYGILLHADIAEQ